MEWAVWKPIYHDILRDFCFDPIADIEAARVLASLTNKGDVPSFSTIVDIMNKQVSICGAARTLEEEIDTLPKGRTIISAGSATSRIMKKGILPDVIVTDLDGETEYEIEANSEGTLLFVLAHGDNMDKIREYVPQMLGPLVPTVQCQPFGVLYNFGGFTDGDRAYLTVKHFGIEDIELIGWDLSKANSKPGISSNIKNKKLTWAGKIIRNY